LNFENYDEVNLQTELDFLCQRLTDDFEYCLKNTGRTPNVFLMVSPYFAEYIMENSKIDKNKVMLANHSNMCCGMGICGSCSYVDEAGKTVRKCKCNNW
jgi:hypothetical protein